MTKEELEEIRKFFDKEQKKDGLKMPEQHVCPHCGRCPVCGRPREAPHYPYQPYWPPYYPPYWTGDPACHYCHYTFSSDSGATGSQIG